MRRIKNIEIEALKEEIELLYMRYRALRNQIKKKAGDDEERVQLEYRKKELWNEIVAKEDELASLEGRSSDYLHMIDFDRAEEIADPVIKRLRETDSAALFLLQNSQSRMGRYYAVRLRKRLEDVSSNIIDISIEPEAIGGCIDEATLLRYIADSEPGLHFDKMDVETAIARLCSSPGNRIIFIKLSFNDNLKERPTLLPWLLKEFWHKLVDHLHALRAEGRRVRVVLTIIALQELNTDLLDRDMFCKGEEFDQRRIVEIPLEMWDREAVKNWLIDHSRLRLTEAEAIAWAEEICAHCPTGLPYLIDTRLRQKLNQETFDKKEPAE